MITLDSKGIYSSVSLAIIGIIMSEKPRNEKSGKFLPEGKESQMIRLDKEIADLGREEIQKLVRQRTEENELILQTLSVVIRYLNENDVGFEEFITEDSHDEETVEKFYAKFV